MVENKKVMLTLREMYDKLTEMGYNVLWISAFGSWNYNVAYENSDIDAKAAVAPKLEDIVYAKQPVSTKVKFDKNEVDVKDVRLFLDLVLKENVPYLESFYTPYMIVNPEYKALFDKLYSLDVAYYDKRRALNTIVGFAKQKLVALDKPYPSKLEVISKFGVDPKQAHHLIRLHSLMNKYIKNLPYKEVIDESKNRDFHIRVKSGAINWSKEEFMNISNRVFNVIENSVEKWKKNNVDYEPNESIADEVKKIKFEFVEKALKQELNK